MNETDATVQYFPENKMLYVQFKAGISTESMEAAPNIVFDYGANNNIIGIEIEDIDLSQEI